MGYVGTYYEKGLGESYSSWLRKMKRRYGSVKIVKTPMTAFGGNVKYDVYTTKRRKR